MVKLPDFLDIYKNWWEGTDDESSKIIRLPPHIRTCGHCKKKIDTNKEAYLFSGEVYCLKEECLMSCPIIRSVVIKTEESTNGEMEE